jgi:hypothetical protein
MTRTLSLLLTLASTIVSLQAQDFEGVITFAMKGPQESRTLEYLTRGEMVRMQFEQAPGMTMAVVVNSKSGAAFVLMTENKTYMEMSLKDMPVPEGAQKDIEFQKTGKTEKILGYACEQILMKQDGTEVEMWVTKGLGRFVQSNFNSKSPAMKKIEDELTSKGYFPLRMASKSGGQNEFRMDALSVTRKQLSKDLFVIPAGFSKMQMPQRQ